LILVGVALTAAGFVLWFSPVQHTQAAPASAKCTNAKDCFVKVDDAPGLILSSIVVLGILLTIVGVNNRRITKFAGPGGIEFDTAADQAGTKAVATVDAYAADLSLSGRTAAKLIADPLAQTGALKLERVVGRPLMPAEIEHVAQESAKASVSAVRVDPSFE